MELTLNPEIVGEESNTLRIKLIEAVQNDTDVLLDFQHTTKIDSIGVAALAEAHLELAKRGSVLRARNLSPELQQLFVFLGLDRHFEGISPIS